MSTTIEFLVAGGQATPGQSIGPELGPTPVDIQDAVTVTNERTAAFNGMEVPVALTYEDDGSFEIDVGVSSTAPLIKGEADIESGSGQPQETLVADLTINQVLTVAEQKLLDLNAYDLQNAAMETAGTCVSLGVTIEGTDPREFAHHVESGAYKKAIETKSIESESR